jgi:hypothetical protein
MDSDDSGKKNRWKIPKEKLNPLFCRCSKRHNYNEGKCQDQDDIDTVDAPEKNQTM